MGQHGIITINSQRDFPLFSQADEAAAKAKESSDEAMIFRGVGWWMVRAFRSQLHWELLGDFIVFVSMISWFYYPAGIG